MGCFLCREFLHILDATTFTLTAGHPPGIPHAAQGIRFNFSVRLLAHRCNSSWFFCGLSAVPRTLRGPYHPVPANSFAFMLLGSTHFMTAFVPHAFFVCTWYVCSISGCGLAIEFCLLCRVRPRALPPALQLSREAVILPCRIHTCDTERPSQR